MSSHTDVHPASAPEPLPGDVITTDDITTDDPAPPARRRGPDPLALIVGLATLAMAVFAFVGELPDLSGFDPRWLLAGGAVAVGLVLLVGSLRNRSGGRRGGSWTARQGAGRPGERRPAPPLFTPTRSSPAACSSRPAPPGSPRRPRS